MAEGISPERQRMIDYLARYHLVAKNIKADDWDEDGFMALNPITGQFQGPIPWPDGFNYDWFCKLYQVADVADFRRLGRSAYAQYLRRKATV